MIHEYSNAGVAVRLFAVNSWMVVFVAFSVGRCWDGGGETSPLSTLPRGEGETVVGMKNATWARERSRGDVLTAMFKVTP